MFKIYTVSKEASSNLRTWQPITISVCIRKKQYVIYEARARLVCKTLVDSNISSVRILTPVSLFPKTKAHMHVCM